MANEFKHGSVGTTLTQAEWEGIGTHVIANQATGDIIYASSATQLSRLGVGSSGQVLKVSGGVPTWGTDTTNVAASALTGTTMASNVVTSSLTTVGTIGSGTWQGTAIASAYLDADTAHLSGTQTFSGTKTFSEQIKYSGTGASGVYVERTGNDNTYIRMKNDTDSNGYIAYESDDMAIYAANNKIFKVTAEGDAYIYGATPSLTVGDAGAEDTKIVWDGNAIDFYIGLDDSADKLKIGT